MPKVKCGHCRAVVVLPDDWGFAGFACPVCSRSTQYPPAGPAPKLPPPTSGYGGQSSSNHGVPAWAIAIMWFAIAIGFAFVCREFADVSVPLAFAYIAALSVGLAIYFIPSFIATNRKHPNELPIFVVNLLLGWTLAGWTVALAWSLIALDKRRR